MTQRWLVPLVFLAGCAAHASATLSTLGAEPLAGEPADVASSAYEFRADRPAQENRPETEFLFTAIKHSKADSLCGLLWEEPRPVKQVVLEWPAGAKSIPKPDEIALRWCSQAGTASWWCRSKEGMRIHESTAPEVSADGLRCTYTLDALSNADALDNLVVVLKGGWDPSKPVDAPTVRVLVPQTWKSMTIAVEWGFQKGTEQKEYDGSIEVYNGVLGTVTPIAEDEGTRIVGKNAWESGSLGAARRGITLPLHYAFS